MQPFRNVYSNDWKTPSLSPSLFPTEPIRSRGPCEESEASDDEMLSLSSQRSSVSMAPQKPDPPPEAPAAPPLPEEVDLLGLGGEEINQRQPSTQPPSTAATATPMTTDLLGDFFGTPAPSSSGPSSTQSTPHKVIPNTASPCHSPAPGEEAALPEKSYILCYMYDIFMALPLVLFTVLFVDAT